MAEKKPQILTEWQNLWFTYEAWTTDEDYTIHIESFENFDASRPYTINIQNQTTFCSNPTDAGNDYYIFSVGEKTSKKSLESTKKAMNTEIPP